MEKTTKSRINTSLINALFLMITLVINTLSALGIINDLTQKEISDMFPTLITPSPSTFSIWSVIYALLLITIIVMMVKKDSPYYKDAIDQISGLFRVSCILNMAWIIAFSYVQMELSVLLIFLFVIVLSLICIKLLKINDEKHWLLPLTFGLYAGWLFIATVVNTAAMLVKLKWNGFGIANTTWAVIIVIVAILLAIVVLSKIRNAVFTLPIAWAYLGIYQSLNSTEGYFGEVPLLQNVVLAGMAVLLALVAIQFYRNGLWILPKHQSNHS